MPGTTFAGREHQAVKIESMLGQFVVHRHREQLSCLDIGCGSGEIARHLSTYFGKVVALDNAFSLVQEAQNKASESRVEFLQADGTRLPFADSVFDVIVCAQVYEHVACACLLPAEVERTLKAGGLCFFSGPNKLWPVEPHYRLPFVHWLPGKLAAFYMRSSGKGERLDVHPYTYWGLRRLWRAFTIHDCTVPLLREPERFGASMRLSGLLRHIPAFVLSMLYFLLPNYNWILAKPHDKEDPH